MVPWSILSEYFVQKSYFKYIEYRYSCLQNKSKLQYRINVIYQNLEKLKSQKYLDLVILLNSVLLILLQNLTMLKESQWIGLGITCIGPTMATGRQSALPGWREPPRPGKLCWKGTCHTLEPLWLTLLTGQEKKTFFIV